MALDVEFVRQQYPTFRDPETARWAMFENAGGSYVPQFVIDRLQHYMRRNRVQPYGPFGPSKDAGEAMDRGYATIAAMMNADPDEITLGPSTTANTYVLAQALRPSLRAGNEIIVTNQDHEANIGAWRRLQEFGVVIREWGVDPGSGELDIASLAALTSQRTRLICFTLCSNIVGTFNPVEEIARIARDVGARTVADAVSYAPHRLPDVQTLGVDFLLLSTYKTYATHLGVLWCHPSTRAVLTNQGHFFNDDAPHYRLNPTGPLHAQIAALEGLGDYIDRLHAHHFSADPGDLHTRASRMFELFGDHETRLTEQLLNGLRDISELQVVGQQSAASGTRAGTVSVICRSTPASQFAQGLAERGVAARNGHFYALRLVKALGVEDTTEGVLRMSLVHYNTANDVDRLVEGLAAVASPVNRESAGHARSA